MMKVLRFCFAVAIVAVAMLPGSASASSKVSFKASSGAPWSFEQAAHLLRRAGFGGTPDQIEHLVQMGRDRAVDYLVDYEQVPIGDSAYPMRENDVKPLERRLLTDLEQSERERITMMLRRLNDQHMQAVRDWWTRRMVVTNRPLQEKMTLFWHGHFTSGFREVRGWREMYAQNEFFRENALADFETLLMGVAKDPAMLKYLDNARNVKTSPNENFARELMELFSLGVGNYSERDIKEAARAFTGWSLDVDGYRFFPRRHDFGTKMFFGRRGRFDGDDIIQLILRHPNAPRFMASNLLDFFVYRDAEPKTIESLAKVIESKDFDFREIMRALLKSDEFYSDRAMFSQIKSPVDLVVGAVRSLEVDTVNPRGLYAACRQMGQNLFQPPNVKGWDGAERWITTNTLFARYNFGKDLVGTNARRKPSTIAGRIADMKRQRNASAAKGKGASDGAMMMDDEMMMRPTLSQITGNSVSTSPYDPRPTLDRLALRAPDEIVQHYVKRLLQRELEPQRFEVLLTAFAPQGKPFRVDARDTPERIRALVSLIMSMPEYQLF